MNLQEYLNQGDPVKNPLVEVKEHEIIRLTRNRITGYSSVMIQGVRNEYVLNEVSGIFYTTDSDGNPKRVSVFRRVS